MIEAYVYTITGNFLRAAEPIFAWLLDIVTQLKILIVRNTGRQGRRPNASYRSVGSGPLPLVANFCEEIDDFSA
jgi:hypothetical protein